MDLCYRLPVEGSADKVAGFALGALLDGDRDAAHIAAQVPRAFHDAARARLSQVRKAEDKREALATLIRTVRPEPTSLADLPEAARLLLAPTPKQRARKPVQTQTIDPDLMAMLKRLAARLSHGAAP